MLRLPLLSRLLVSPLLNAQSLSPFASALTMATTQSSLDDHVTLETSAVLADPSNADAKEKPFVVVLEPKQDREYLTGFKLSVVVAAVSFVSFLMLLDNMIVSTVRRASKCPSWRRLIMPSRPSRASPTSFTPSLTLVGTPVHTSLGGTFCYIHTQLCSSV